LKPQMCRSHGVVNSASNVKNMVSIENRPVSRQIGRAQSVHCHGQPVVGPMAGHVVTNAALGGIAPRFKGWRHSDNCVLPA